MTHGGEPAMAAPLRRPHAWPAPAATAFAARGATSARTSPISAASSIAPCSSSRCSIPPARSSKVTAPPPSPPRMAGSLAASPGTSRPRVWCLVDADGKKHTVQRGRNRRPQNRRHLAHALEPHHGHLTRGIRRFDRLPRNPALDRPHHTAARTSRGRGSPAESPARPRWRSHPTAASSSASRPARFASSRAGDCWMHRS